MRLRALGMRREERILICLADTIDWPTAFLGAIKAGVVAVPVNTLLTEDDYRFMLATAARGCWSFPRIYSEIRQSDRPATTWPTSSSPAADAHGHLRSTICWPAARRPMP